MDLRGVNSMQGRNVAMHDSKAPLSFSPFPCPLFFLLPFPSTSFFLTLPELITPLGHPETNSQVRNHFASLTAQPIPTNSYLMGSYSCVSPGPPRDFLSLSTATLDHSLQSLHSYHLHPYILNHPHPSSLYTHTRHPVPPKEQSQ